MKIFFRYRLGLGQSTPIFFFGHQHLNIFKLLCTQEPPHRSSRAIQQILVFEDTNVKLIICSESFGIRTNRSEFGPIVRNNRSEFGPIVRDSDQSIGIRTSRSEFGPITNNSNQSLFTHFGPISTQIWTVFYQFYNFPLAEH